jgi:hypothetical protein
MGKKKRDKRIHPTGERQMTGSEPLSVETFAGRIHVEWNPQAEVTPMGQLPFFIDFLKTAELFDPWVTECPIHYTSPNAPSTRDILGTVLLSVLAGHKRYAHITTIRSDSVNPRLLGMKRVMSEDSVRRAFTKASPTKCTQWQRNHLRRCWELLLYEPWILDIDSTVKPLYGRQEGAVVGFNPHKPGRPSHVFHTYLIANLRLVLDVEVQQGNQTAGKYARRALFDLIENLPEAARPAFIRGDISFGSEDTMREAEQRRVYYLFKLRQSKNVKRLIEVLFRDGQWIKAGQGWEGSESSLKLSGWSCHRRVMVLRRELKGKVVMTRTRGSEEQQEFAFLETAEGVKRYEYAVLVTSLTDDIEVCAQHYRDRADAENGFDELKNQWGWGGFTTHDIHRCQVMARNTALLYNWWSLFARLAIPERHAEAITSRPLLLEAVGQQTRHGRQTHLMLTSTHGNHRQLRRILRRLTVFFAWLRSNAEQLTWVERWRHILSLALVKFLRGRLLRPPPIRLGFNP